MSKDRSKNYCTAAFRDFSFYGKKSRTEVEIDLYNAEYKKTLSDELASEYINKRKPLLDDIGATHKTVEKLKEENPDILKAVEEVYFSYPTIPLRRNDIVMRIRFFSLHKGVSERTVYIWLKKARHLFADFRGIQV